MFLWSILNETRVVVENVASQIRGDQIKLCEGIEMFRDKKKCHQK